MSSELGIRSKDRAVLRSLLLIKREVDKLGVKVSSLEDAINAQEAIMPPEDFAFVQKLVEKHEQ